jgi:hypothetical protein
MAMVAIAKVSSAIASFVASPKLLHHSLVETAENLAVIF